MRRSGKFLVAWRHRDISDWCAQRVHALTRQTGEERLDSLRTPGARRGVRTLDGVRSQHDRDASDVTMTRNVPVPQLFSRGNRNEPATEVCQCAAALDARA
jgi:hypothetical protein